MIYDDDDDDDDEVTQSNQTIPDGEFAHFRVPRPDTILRSSKLWPWALPLIESPSDPATTTQTVPTASSTLDCDMTGGVILRVPKIHGAINVTLTTKNAYSQIATFTAWSTWSDLHQDPTTNNMWSARESGNQCNEVYSTNLRIMKMLPQTRVVAES